MGTRRLAVLVLAACVVVGACGGGGGPEIETAQVEAALDASRAGIDVLRLDDDGAFDEANVCLPRNAAGTIAEAVADEVAFDIFAVERFAGAFASESGRVEANVCDWLDFDSEDRRGVVGVGVAHGPLTVPLEDLSPAGWEIDGEASEISRSEALDGIQDGDLWFTCIDFASEDIEDVCELAWARADLAVLVYVYSIGGAPPLDPQALTAILDEQLPLFIGELAES